MPSFPLQAGQLPSTITPSAFPLTEDCRRYYNWSAGKYEAERREFPGTAAAAQGVEARGGRVKEKPLIRTDSIGGRDICATLTIRVRLFMMAGHQLNSERRTISAVPAHTETAGPVV